MKIHGIDIHNNNIQVYQYDMELEVPLGKYSTFGLDKQSLDKFRSTLSKSDVVILECTTNSFWFYDQTAPYVKECLIIDPFKLQEKTNKNDKIDAKRMVDVFLYSLLSRDQSLFVYVPDKKVRELRSLFSTYRFIMKDKTRLTNKIHFIFAQNGIKINRGLLSLKQERENLLNKTNLDFVLTIQISSLLKLLNAVESEITKIKQTILCKGLSLFEREIKLLITIPGFSAFTACAVLSDIADISRFQSAKKFCSYLRTAPTIKESNNTKKQGKVSKRSRTLSCTILTQSVNHFKRAGIHMTEFYERLRHKKSPGKTRMAMIRKMLVSAFFMLKRNKNFKYSHTVNTAEKMKKFNRLYSKIDQILNKLVEEVYKNVA